MGTISLPFELNPFGVSDIQDVLVENDIKIDYSPRGDSDMETISEAWLPVSPVSSPEEKVVERMSMPRASIFASTGDNLTSINIRPQPIIRKRKMVAVPEEHKDEKYWEKRLKNKEATRRSREAKRLKQNQIALRAAHLERENKN